MQDDWGLDFENTDGQWQNDDFPIPGPGRKRFHLSLFLHALLGGVLGTLIGRGIYVLMYNPSGNNVVMAGLILAVISAFVLLACAICELCRPRITMNQELNLSRILSGLLVAVAVFAVGCLCEFLYELNSAYTAIKFDDYVFAIDDSGSMAETDPQDLRYSALAELLDTMDEDKRAGLVRFVENIYVEPVELAALDEEQRARLSESIAVPRSDGGTDIYSALVTSLDMHQSSAQAGRYPVVVLLSDGFSETPLKDITRRFLDAGVAISTVGLGPRADEELLQNLAQTTGGQYFKVEQAGDLAEAFQQVSTAVAYRCLFSPRPGIQRGSILYMVLRVVLLTLPSLLIGFFILLLLRGGNVSQLLVSGATGLLAGLVMEIGTFFFLPLTITQILSWLLYSIVLLHYNDNASGMRQSDVETLGPSIEWGNGWEDFPTGVPRGEVSLPRKKSGGRIDHGNDGRRF